MAHFQFYLIVKLLRTWDLHIPAVGQSMDSPFPPPPPPPGGYFIDFETFFALNFPYPPFPPK